MRDSFALRTRLRQESGSFQATESRWKRRPQRGNISVMSTITVILEAQPDGTLHLPLPVELRGGKVEVIATLRAASDSGASLELASPPIAPRATPEMVKRRSEAFAALRAMGGLHDEIPDPAAWQREIRKDRSLPGRD
jgi:hypothetical protein